MRVEKDEEHRVGRGVAPAVALLLGAAMKTRRKSFILTWRIDERRPQLKVVVCQTYAIAGENAYTGWASFTSDITSEILIS